VSLRAAFDRPPRPLLAGAITLSVLAVSTAAILVRLSDAPPLAVAFHRLLYATLLLAPFALVLSWRELRALRLTDWAGLFLVGAVLALHFAAWITSLSLTSVAASVVLVTLHPVAVALLSHRLFGEGIGRAGYVGIGVALLGGLVITASDAGTGPMPLLGDALALLGAAAAAFYFLAGRSYRKRLGLLAYVVPVYASCALVLGVLLVALPAPYGGPLLGYGWREHVLFLALALVPMILGHTVLNWALAHVTAPVIATTILGEPIGSTLLAALLLHETPPVGVLLGGAVVLAGILLVARHAGAPGASAAETPGP
jgi:drug/metabolite transporter (DMT)-like permease